jgi:hypothetical protein
MLLIIDIDTPTVNTKIQSIIGHSKDIRNITGAYTKNFLDSGNRLVTARVIPIAVPSHIIICVSI